VVVLFIMVGDMAGDVVCGVDAVAVDDLHE
jgi:hypothetical protein